MEGQTPAVTPAVTPAEPPAASGAPKTLTTDWSAKIKAMEDEISELRAEKGVGAKLTALETKWSAIFKPAPAAVKEKAGFAFPAIWPFDE